MKRFEYIGIIGGRAFGLVEENAGWIFQDISNPAFGADGYHKTKKEAVLSAIKLDMVVVNEFGLVLNPLSFQGLTD
jgi:hypothetical protein